MNDDFREEIERAKEFLRSQSQEDSSRQQFEQEVQQAKEFLRNQQQKEGTIQKALKKSASTYRTMPNMGEKIARGIRGMAGTYGSMGDLAHGASKAQAKFLESEFSPLLDKAFEKATGKKPERVEAPDSNFGEQAHKLVDKLYGKDLTPTNEHEKFEQDTGAFLTPMGLPGLGAVKAGVVPPLKSAVKWGFNLLTKRLPSAATASAAVNLTPRMTKEGTLPGAAEDVVKALVGQGIPGAIKKTASTAYNTVRHPIDTSAKILSKFMTPDERVLELAGKHAVELPFNVGADSHVLDFTANNYLKSMFASKAYTDSLKRSNQSMVNAVKRSLDTLGEQNILPSAGSEMFKDQLKLERRALQKESTKMYDSVRGIVQNEQVSPNRLLSSLRSEKTSELLNNPFLTDESRKVVEKILKIKDKFDTNITEDMLRQQFPGISEHSLSRMMRNAQNKSTVPVKDLISLRKYLLSSIDYNPEVYGIESFLSNLAKSVDKDIRSMSNSGALNQYLSANKFYYDNIASRFKNSMASSLLKGDRPIEAYNMMNSVTNIKEMQKIAGRDPKSLEIFNSLKKARAREIIGKAIEGDLKSDGTLRAQPFSNIFKKGEGRNEVLEALLGKKEYNNLCELGEISESFAKHGRNLLNTSGTAHVASDFKLTKNAFNAVMDSVGFAVNGGIGYAGYTVAGLPGAAAGLASPWLVSRLVSSEKFVNKARDYARARMAGKEKLADRILNSQLIPIGVREYGKIQENDQRESESRNKFEQEVQQAKEFLRSQNSS